MKLEMRDEMDSVKAILDSEEYRTLLLDVCREIGYQFDDDIPEVLLENDAQQLQVAGLNVAELKAVLIASGDAVKRFATIKFKELEDKNDDGEFPADEPQGEDEKSKVVGIHPMFWDFLISYLIEYTLAIQNPNRLDSYLKTMRFPSVNKYAEQLKRWVKQADVAP